MGEKTEGARLPGAATRRVRPPPAGPGPTERLGSRVTRAGLLAVP